MIFLQKMKHPGQIRNGMGYWDNSDEQEEGTGRLVIQCFFPVCRSRSQKTLGNVSGLSSKELGVDTCPSRNTVLTRINQYRLGHLLGGY